MATRPTTPIRFRRAEHRHHCPTARRPRQRAARDERGSTSSLELMALTPLLALGVLLILWSGRSARAEFLTTLAAQEAAVAAAVCCSGSRTAEPDSLHRDQFRELAAEAVLGARPGLDHLCLNGPQPAPGAAGFVAQASVDFEQSAPAAEHARAVRIVTTHVTCETDGAIAPLRGLFPTRTVHGHGAHVVVHAGASTAPARPTPVEPDRSDRQ